jgi:hypothetical protein
MKLYVTFKDPDQLSEAIDDKRLALTHKLKKELGLSEAGAEAEAEERMKVFDDMTNKYFEWGEYLTVELDSETQTIRVIGKDEEVEND